MNAVAGTDKFGRIKIELKLKKAGAPVLNKLQIMKLVSVVCERDFDVPAVNESGGDIFITLSEHAALRVDVGIEQKCASESMMCGDAYRYFFDGHGHFITVLSDGMGTGGRARSGRRYGVRANVQAFKGGLRI